MTGQFGDTTFTKVFVGGLAWETQKETMSSYFEQFGEILEAVVITDKNTGRSKGYGFVTFREPDAAMRACVDPAPVIDGRRANCNLAYLGVQKSRPTSPKHGAGKSFRTIKSFHGAGIQGGMASSAFTSSGSFPHYAIQQGIPYGLYGYSQYSPDYSYPTGYYNFYGGAAAQYPFYGGASGVLASGNAAFYPFFQLGHGEGAAATPTYAQGQAYPRQYPGFYPYSAAMAATGFAPQPHGGPMSFAAPASPPPPAGMRTALPLQFG